LSKPKSILQSFIKEAGVLSATSDFAGNVAGSIARGALPVDKTAPIGEKLIGLGVKGALGYGTYKGLRSIAAKPPTPLDYTFMQRNRLLAGEIKPEEIAGDELAKIKRLGMKYE
jgi:hypothetical protein